MNFNEINEKTGFAEGDKWSKEEELESYFRVETMNEIFGEDHGLTQEELTKMKLEVMDNRWHCTEDFKYDSYDD